MNYALNLIMKSVVHQSVTGLIVVKYKNMYSCWCSTHIYLRCCLWPVCVYAFIKMPLIQSVQYAMTVRAYHII